MKECNKCKIEKPATPEYFHRDKSKKDGLDYTCKECKNGYMKKHYQKNKEEKREYGKKHYQENKERYREAKRKHYQENKEKIREAKRNYYHENKEYYANQSKKYHEENKEEISERKRKYYQENPEVGRLNDQRRRARVAQLPHTLTVEEWEEALEYFDYSCAYCGISDEILHQEHVIPVVKGGGYTADNIIPACGTCNLKKHTADLEEWYVSYEHYNKERLNKILDYVEIMEEI